MPKVRIVDVDLENIDAVEFPTVEKFSELTRTKMKSDDARFKNKKQNKGRERNRE